jgi:hypothetical protein
MANSLKRDIESGEVLVLRKGAVRSTYADPQDRLFIAEHGNGMSAEARGSNLSGREARFEGGKLFRETRVGYSGHDISARETKAWQAAHGRLVSEYTVG